MNKRKWKIKDKKISKQSQYKFYNQHGITLIALVITIIVMLILAGVSLNATIGENGIISKAKEANMKSGIAALEEYIQEFYVENYDVISQSATPLDGIKKLKPNWFYKNKAGYVVDSEGYVHYFLVKENFPSEISQQLIGGDREGKTYADYIRCNDVYGLTSNLKVYYCANGANSFLSTSGAVIDKDSPNREVFGTDSKWTTAIASGDETVTAQNIKQVTTLKLNETSGITEFSEAYKLISLETLNLENLNVSLDGLENLTKLKYLTIKNCTIQDAKALSQITTLQKLYIINPTQEDVTKILNAMGGVAYDKLQYLGIYANDSKYYKLVTDIDAIANFNTSVKDSLEYLYLQNEDISNINFLNGFSKIYELNITKNNKITTLSGLTSKRLRNLYAEDCNLGKDETEECSIDNALYPLTGCTNLKTVALRRNNNIKHVNYLLCSSSYSYIYFSGCGNIIESELAEIASRMRSATGTDYNSNYKDIVNGSEKLDYANRGFTDTTDKFLALKGNVECKALRLDSNTGVSQEKLNEILSTMTSIKVLSLRNLTQLTNISFVQNMPNLVELDLWGCSNLTDLSILETLRNSNSQKLGTLRINNPNIVLNNIQKTISYLKSGSGGGSWSFVNTWGGYNGFVAPKSVWKNLEGCSNITSIAGSYCNQRNQWDNEFVDLTGCTSLKSITLRYNAVKLKMPDVTESITCQIDSIGSNLIFTENSHLKSANITSSESKWTNDKMSIWCNNLSKCQELTTITFADSGVDHSSPMTKLVDIEKLSECAALRNLSINYMKNLKDITGIGKISQLTSLSLYYNRALEDISDFDCEYDEEGNLVKGLVNLTSLNLGYGNIAEIKSLSVLKNLQSLSLIGNRIYNLYSLKELNQLTSLNIQNNCIYDDAYYKNEENIDVRFKNTDIIVELNKNSLRYIYMSGNAIEDLTAISNIKNWGNGSNW